MIARLLLLLRDLRDADCSRTEARRRLYAKLREEKLPVRKDERRVAVEES